MPISFLERNESAPLSGEPKQQQQQQHQQRHQLQDPKLKARLLAREFAAHRYGLFKESGFRNDFMYPPFASLAGLSLAGAGKQRLNRTLLAGESTSATDWPAELTLKGFDADWNECAFDTQPASGLPTSQAAGCVAYLTRVGPPSSSSSAGVSQPQSFNLMSADPFSHADLSARFGQQQQRPLEWRELADSIKWHFCGDNFAAPASNGDQTTATGTIVNRHQESYAHNQQANNKQNVLCQERSAMEVIKASEDFKRAPFR